MLEIVNRNLSIGMVVKNYKEMCRLLNQDTKDGSRNKKYQEKEWQRFFKWERSKNKYIIIDIYSEPLPIDDKRKVGNHSQYVEHIELLLLNYLSKQDGYKASFTLKELFKFLCLCNYKYYILKKSEIEEQLQISQYQVNHFYQRTYQKFKDIVFSSLRNLQRRFLIKYTETIMISRTEGFGEKAKEFILPATENEIKDILAVKRFVLEQMGLESITLVYLKFKQDEFNSKVNSILKLKHGINYSFTQIDLIFNHPHIIKALEQAELQRQRKLLNDKVVDTINKQAEKTLKKNHEDYDRKYNELIDAMLGEPYQGDIDKLFRLNENYLEVQETLAELLIRI